ncbi:hypoxanthine phosphoribosyltransferase [Paractinoplanes hotanensis]|uniref:Hypoxanthine phosphoribosyltransferase n=1 Tax=Paractinoplanes hotanensis TaxID=2906497 RepID=A0ABT0XWL5_9ACTN|nr:hypoxanthine phosphoribosyltransferase [Actinoplanes hotanensis]MCM4077628.1 hypoxanthine phosphoribosyltransferase [Actinoplanes hotanensis]
MDASHVADDLESVILTEEQILARVGELAAELHERFGSRTPVLVGVLGGAATFTVDLARAYPGQVEIGWMAAKSYSTGNRASGSLRLLKDLDIDITGRDVVIVDGVIDTGLTMSWLIANLAQREPASITVCALLRKPETAHVEAGTPTYVGFDVGEGLIVGYGLDHEGHYRNLRCAAVLAPAVYAARRGRRVAPHGRT